MREGRRERETGGEEGGRDRGENETRESERNNDRQRTLDSHPYSNTAYTNSHHTTCTNS